MKRSAIAMPPFKVVAAALRKTTEYLAREVARPLGSPPEWTELEWAIAQSSAAMQGISTLLANTLRWSGPSVWQAFMTEQRKQSVLRDAHIDHLLQRLDAAMRAAGIGCVALKGSALRRLDLYRPGERPMGDVDVLVSTGDVPSVTAVMGEIDYVDAYTTQRHLVYEPRGSFTLNGFGEHVDNPLRIEVHTAVAEALPARHIDITDRLWFDRIRPGINAYPDLAALLLHLLLHAAGNMRANALRQVQLHDIAALASRLGEEDWGALLRSSPSTGRLWWAYPPLALTARYYPGCIAAEILEESRALCPRPLRFSTDRRMLTDVSWSNLRIHAFPGISWSRTPLDALRFVRSRVLPSRRALAELHAGLESRPQLEQVPWYGISHGTRIARWLVSRPPRVQTVVSVTAALRSTGYPRD